MTGQRMAGAVSSINFSDDGNGFKSFPAGSSFSTSQTSISICPSGLSCLVRSLSLYYNHFTPSLMDLSFGILRKDKKMYGSLIFLSLATLMGKYSLLEGTGTTASSSEGTMENLDLGIVTNLIRLNFA